VRVLHSRLAQPESLPIKPTTPAQPPSNPTETRGVPVFTRRDTAEHQISNLVLRAEAPASGATVTRRRVWRRRPHFHHSAGRGPPALLEPRHACVELRYLNAAGSLLGFCCQQPSSASKGLRIVVQAFSSDGGGDFPPTSLRPTLGRAGRGRNGRGRQVTAAAVGRAFVHVTSDDRLPVGMRWDQWGDGGATWGITCPIIAPVAATTTAAVWACLWVSTPTRTRRWPDRPAQRQVGELRQHQG
jgi:hypothetical protein